MMPIRSRCKLFNASFVSRESFRIYSSSSSSTEQAPVVFSDLENSILSSADPKNSVLPILNQWIEQGRPVTQPVLNRIISRLTSFRRFTHALQVSEWMSNKLDYDLSPETFAKRINLISKVHGLEHAEAFFKGIPDAKIGFKVYAALLSCYAEHNSLEEAEVIMNKIKKLRPVRVTVCYNTMLKLYAQTGKIEKLDRLMQEMKEKEICNSATFTIALNGYVVAGDIGGMEELLMQMEANPLVTVDWYIYAAAAKGYIKAGNIEKASATLKKAENLVTEERRRLAYESLQTMYAAIGKRDEVYRLWNKCKTLRKSHNSSYKSMLSSLVKLNDIEGAEKILQEWESDHTNFDLRIPNMMITAYCKWGLVDKAEAYIKRLLDNGKELDGSTWDRLSSAYCMDNDMEKAVQTMKKYTSTSRRRWRADPSTLSACIKYLKEKGDVESALEILNLVKEDGHISATAYDGLVSYVHGETLDTEAFDLTKQDSKMDGSIQVHDGGN